MAEKSEPVADQFGDDEMDRIKRYGQALGGSPTEFDEEVERCLNERLRARGELPDEEKQ